MSATLTADAIQELLRCAAAQGSVESSDFVAALSSALGLGESCSAAGLLVKSSSHSLRSHLNPIPASSGHCPLWNKEIRFPDPGSLLAYVERGNPWTEKLSASTPLGDALLEAGLTIASFAPLSTLGTCSGLLCVASAQSDSALAPLELMSSAAQVVATIQRLLQGKPEVPVFSSLESVDYFATMGRLSGGLVHEVNNPATFIALAAGQIAKALARYPEVKELEPVAALARDISESVRQMRGVVADFQVLSSVARHAVSGSIDLARMIRACAVLTQIAYHSRTKIEVQVDELPACPSALASTAPVVVHLLLNAIQSIPEERSDSSLIVLRASASEQQLYISVRDTGVGMESEVQARAFEPFFTTRKAAGLGLTLARETVHHLGGKILLQSTVGEGTLVELTVPLS